MLKITKTTEQDKLTLIPAGRLDTMTAPELEAELKASLPGVTELTFDLKDLEYISSSGLRVLLSILKQAKSVGSRVVLKNVNEVIRDVLDISGFISIFEME